MRNIKDWCFETGYNAQRYMFVFVVEPDMQRFVKSECICAGLISALYHIVSFKSELNSSSCVYLKVS